MKKLLSLLGAFGLTASASATVIACGSRSEADIEQALPDTNLYEQQKETLKNDIIDLFSKSITKAKNEGGFNPNESVQGGLSFLNLFNDRSPGKKWLLPKLSEGKEVPWWEFSKNENLVNSLNADINSLLKETALRDEVNKKMLDNLYYGAIKPRDGKKFFETNGTKSGFFRIEGIEDEKKPFLEKPTSLDGATSSGDKKGIFILNFKISINSGREKTPFLISDKSDKTVELWTSNDKTGVPSADVKIWLSNDNDLSGAIENFKIELLNELSVKEPDKTSPLMIGVDIDNKEDACDSDCYNDNILSVFSKNDTKQNLGEEKGNAESVSEELFKNGQNFKDFQTLAKDIAEKHKFSGVKIEKESFDFLSASNDSLNQVHEINKRTNNDPRGTRTINKYLVPETGKAPADDKPRYLYNWFINDEQKHNGGKTVIANDAKRFKKLKEELEDESTQFKNKYIESSLKMEENFNVWTKSLRNFNTTHKTILEKKFDEVFVEKNGYHIGFFELKNFKVTYNSISITLPIFSLPYLVYATSKVAGDQERQVVNREDMIYIVLDNYFAYLKKVAGITENIAKNKTLMLLDSKNDKTVKKIIEAFDQNHMKYNTSNNFYQNEYYDRHDFDYDGIATNTRHIYNIGKSANASSGSLKAARNLKWIPYDKLQRVANYENPEFYFSAWWVYWEAYEISKKYGFAWYSTGNWDAKEITDNMIFRNQIIGNINVFFSPGLRADGRKRAQQPKFNIDVKTLTFVMLLNENLDDKGNIK